MNPVPPKQPKRRQSRKSGLSPGTLVHIGKKRTEPTRIRLLDYDNASCQERELTSVEECFSLLESPSITWVHVDGVHSTEIINALGQKVGLHPLVREDIVNTDQRPKIEDHENHLFIVMKMRSVDNRTHASSLEQVSLVLGPTYVITFQETSGETFEPVRNRIRNVNGRHRRQGADYLLYSLLDAIVDEYFLALETISDGLEELETELISNPRQELLQRIYQLKRELITFRKSVWPTREVVNATERSDSPLIQQTTRIYLRDVYDHTVQVMDTLESQREVATSLLETYLSSISNRMNEVMKVLTLIATIFIPLTFIAGIYGMNFEHMPELAWTWFYPFGFWGIILAVGGFMVWFFRKRKWL